jgi:acyl-CoA synthetase (AMP-forming)/AMP-acid ligase II
MYIRGGYNLCRLEVEAVLASHPSVAQVAVVPRPDPVMGQVGAAVVVPVDPSDPPTLDDLRRFPESRLARHELPEALHLIDQLPLTSIHKLDRSTSRRLAAELSTVQHSSI